MKVLHLQKKERSALKGSHIKEKKTSKWQERVWGRVFSSVGGRQGEILRISGSELDCKYFNFSFGIEVLRSSSLVREGIVKR